MFISKLYPSRLDLVPIILYRYLVSYQMKALTASAAIEGGMIIILFVLGETSGY